MTTENPFDGMEATPVSAEARQAISQADAVMQAANLPSYTDLLNGLEKLSRKAMCFHPVTVAWMQEHIAPLRPK